MSLRLAFAFLLAVLMLGAGAALFFRNPQTAIISLLFAAAGALVAHLLSMRWRDLSAAHADKLRAGVLSESRYVGNLLPGDQVAGEMKTAGAIGGVTGDVPAGALLKATMDSMREGVLMVDQGMRVVASNRAARDLFDAVDGELVARRLTELTRNPSIHAAFLAALERGERGEVKVETQTGERRVFDLQVAPLPQPTRGQSAEGSANGGIRGAVGVFFDITRLERLERVRQEFLSNVSHELRTPLTAIITFVETLEAGAIDDPEHNRRFLSVIRRNSERMHNLIDDILELSAIEAGTVTVEVDAVQLHSLVGECVTALTATADEQQVILHNEVASDTFVYADARRLEQMLTNLIHNAIKFNREGGTVHVRYERHGTRDRISVTDTGEGIAPEHIERIFERFYRVDRARSRALGGTGLGLAIVKHLTRAHGGEATVRSTPNQGSTFAVELPAAPPK